MADTETRDPTDLYLDLESAICDVAQMASIAANEVHETLEGDGGGPSDAAMERALFSVNHVHAMAEKLKADYYAAWKRSKADASA